MFYANSLQDRWGILIESWINSGTPSSNALVMMKWSSAKASSSSHRMPLPDLGQFCLMGGYSFYCEWLSDIWFSISVPVVFANMTWHPQRWHCASGSSEHKRQTVMAVIRSMACGGGLSGWPVLHRSQSLWIVPRLLTYVQLKFIHMWGMKSSCY